VFASLWRVWLGIVLIVFFGIPILSVLSWIVGGVFGFVVLAVAAAIFVGLLWKKNP
jgi:hypothetical protein